MKFGSSKQEESEPGRSKMYTIEDKVRDMDLDNYAIDMDNNHNYGNRKKENAKKNTLSSFFCCSGSTTQQDEINMAKEVNIKDHLLSVIDLERKFATNLTLGLTQSEAQFRLKRDGPNAFSPPKMTPAWVELLKELTAGFSLLFWISGAASLVCYAFSRLPQDYYLAIVLFSVVILTGVYSWSQKQSNKKIFDSFKKMMPQETIVIRDGKAVKMSAENLVCGDLVQCKAGERIPADVRILNCEGMKVDNSTLTGESEPLSRSPEFVHPQPLEAKNLAFFSTSCVEGSGLGMVIATGDDTVMGKIAKLVTNLQTRDAPIVREVNRFVVIIAVIAICEGLTFFVICMLLKMNLFASLIFTIGIITGNIPEGLLPSVTVSLTITAKKLAAKNCMIKYLEAVEILGSTSTICSDKTGTLTENRMTVEHCYLAGSIIRVPHDRIKVGELTRGVAQCWNAYQRCAKLCSRAFFNPDSIEQDIMKREVSGDASETAILRFMESISDQSVDNYRESLPKVAEKPFSSVYKYQYSVHRNLDPNQSNGSDFFVVMKGAPERILSLCSKIIDKNGNTVPLTEQDVKDFEHAYRELGSLGERVLAFCDTELHGFAVDHHFNLEDESTADFEIKNMRFIGLVAMIDPPRASVPGAVRKCKDAGINVVMVTGDHPITAQAIAKSVGIITASHRRSTQISLLKIDKQINQKRNTASIVVPGDELAVLTDVELRDILRSFNEIVFARTSPQQKLRIVENFQSLDKIVAVTGDGVNDSPALKKADIGVAMGITGSDVSKQAADMILMDDNFATIVLGVEEGRKIFDNLKKTTSYITAGSISTLYPFIFYLVFGFPVSITSLLILCICLGTDMMPAISLSYEKAESDIMRQQPRNPVKDYLVTRSLLLWSLFQGGMIVTLSGFTGYFVTLMQYGWMPWQLWQLRNGWDLDVTMVDWYNQEMNLTQRNLIMNKAQTAYFVSVVVCQVMNVIMNKTRRRSIFTHQMGNWVLNFAILFEVALCCAMVYTPGLNKALTCTPVSGWPWATGVPFALYILCYEELRKWIVRSWPTSWIGAELTR